MTNVGSLFEKLLVSGRAISDAEVVGATAGVDLLSLFESAADKCFAAGQHARALLYVFGRERFSLVIVFAGVATVFAVRESQPCVGV